MRVNVASFTSILSWSYVINITGWPGHSLPSPFLKLALNPITTIQLIHPTFILPTVVLFAKNKIIRLSKSDIGTPGWEYFMKYSFQPMFLFKPRVKLAQVKIIKKTNFILQTSKIPRYDFIPDQGSFPFLSLFIIFSKLYFVHIHIFASQPG